MSRIQLVVILKLAAAMLLFLQTPHSAAGVFKCTGADGRVSYQSRPCEGANAQAKIKIRTHRGTYTNSDSVTTSSNEDTAAKEAAPAVVLYSTAWCGYCKKIRKLFKDNNISYKEYDIEKSASAKRQYDKLNGKGVPLTTIDGTLVRGFNRDRLLSLARPRLKRVQ